MTVPELAPAAVPMRVPEPEQVGNLLRDLTGTDVEVGPARPVLPGSDAAGVCVYVTEDGALGAVVACDLPLAACAGAALGMVPPSEVEAAVAAGSLPPGLAADFAEVANVLATVFHGDGGAPYLQLQEVHPAGQELPAELDRVLRYVVRRLDLQVALAGYGGGRLSIVVLV